ncbi:MAG: hypothetical protein ABI333_25960 [bacterium]
MLVSDSVLSSGCLRRFVPVLLGVALLLIGAGPAKAQAEPHPELLSVELAPQGGALIAYGLPDFRGNGAGGLDLRATWPLGKWVRLGLRVALHITVAPYGIHSPGSVAWLGLRPDEADTDPELYPSLATLIPSVSLLFTVRLWKTLELDLAAGVVSMLGLGDSGGGRSQRTSPILCAGLSVFVYRHRTVAVGIRAVFDAFPIIDHPSKPWIFAPQLALVLRFPVRRKPPAVRRVPLPWGQESLRKPKL